MISIETIKEAILPVLVSHQIKRAGIFGSAATGEATDESDIDILIELDTKIGLLEFIGIKHKLEALLGKKVDLVEYAALKSRLRERILAEEIQVYG